MLGNAAKTGAAFDRVGTSAVAWVVAGGFVLVVHSFASAVGGALREHGQPPGSAAE